MDGDFLCGFPRERERETFFFFEFLKVFFQNFLTIFLIFLTFFSLFHYFIYLYLPIFLHDFSQKLEGGVFIALVYQDTLVLAAHGKGRTKYSIDTLFSTYCMASVFLLAHAHSCEVWKMVLIRVSTNPS